jgi:hypothetical protein
MQAVRLELRLNVRQKAHTRLRALDRRIGICQYVDPSQQRSATMAVMTCVTCLTRVVYNRRVRGSKERNRSAHIKECSGKPPASQIAYSEPSEYIKALPPGAKGEGQEE